MQLDDLCTDYKIIDQNIHRNAYNVYFYLNWMPVKFKKKYIYIILVIYSIFIIKKKQDNLIFRMYSYGRI